MSALILAMTTSIDGYATGPDISVEDAMGVGGEALHEWIFGTDPVDQSVAKSLSAGIGACIVGRTMHDLGLGDGVRLFDNVSVAPTLETVSSVSSSRATHLVLRTAP